MNTRHDDDRFDAAMRDLHAQAVSQVSAATMAGLHRRRHAALHEAGPRRVPRWALATAFASVCALAIGLGSGLLRDDGMPPAPAGVAAASASVSVDDIDDAFASLDENPDFYLWLASSDATLLAME